MLGFIIGSVCLVGLVHVLRRGRRWHGPYGQGFGGGPCHDGGGWARGGTRWGRRGGGWGGRWFLRAIFERLETTPGQEKAILGALDELTQNKAVLRDEIKQTRADLGRAVASGFVDDSTLDEAFARHDRLLAQQRVSFVEALKKVTEALDEKQRKHVAELLEGGGLFGGRWGGPGHGGSAWA